MSYVAKGEKEYDAAGPVPTAKLHRIRITLTSSNVLKSVRVSRYLSLVLFF
jgi:small subunit ribosomal protein S20e